MELPDAAVLEARELGLQVGERGRSALEVQRQALVLLGATRLRLLVAPLRARTCSDIRVSRHSRTCLCVHKVVIWFAACAC